MSDIIVHELPGAWGLPSISPFCLKLQTWLRVAGIPYTTVVEATPFRAPKGKLPYIAHEGRRIADSGFVIEYLSERFGPVPDARLSPSERAIGLAMRRLVEENLYWVMVYDRWVIEPNWLVFRDVVLAGVPAPLRPLIAPIARRGVKKQLEGHGIGRHGAEEVHAIGRRDVGALADLLADKPFFFGDTATELDAIAYGLLANVIDVPIASPVKDYARSRANLVAFVARMRSRYFDEPAHERSARVA